MPCTCHYGFVHNWQLTDTAVVRTPAAYRATIGKQEKVGVRLETRRNIRQIALKNDVADVH